MNSPLIVSIQRGLQRTFSMGSCAKQTHLHLIWALPSQPCELWRPIQTHWAPHCLRAAYGASQTSSGTRLTIQIGGINLPGTRHSTSIWGYICRSLVPFCSPQGYWAVHGKKPMSPHYALEKQLPPRLYAERQRETDTGGRQSFNFVPSRMSLFRLRPLIKNVFEDM